jgi:hypothetical protein
MPTNEIAEQAAITTARNWLALIDRGDSAESWNQAASLFKASVSREQWQDSLAAAQFPLGKPISRSLKSKQYAEELAGAPDGKYYVLVFETSFERKQQGTETVVPMIDESGEWRVSGYFVQ